MGLADAPRQGEAGLRHNREAIARSKTEQGPELGFVLSETGSPCCVLSRRVTRCRSPFRRVAVTKGQKGEQRKQLGGHRSDLDSGWWRPGPGGSGGNDKKPYSAGQSLQGEKPTECAADLAVGWERKEGVRCDLPCG